MRKHFNIKTIKIAIFCFFFAFFQHNFNDAFSLVGVKEAKDNSKKKGKNSSGNANKKKKTTDKTLRTGEKDDDIPDFPSDGVEEYKMLFDDGFSNVVDDEFQTGESFDVFVDAIASNNINKTYMTGNEEFITQMDVVEAEKKTLIDNNSIDKSNITTHRTRIMAYLTLEQMLYADMFGLQPHGYYVNAVQKK